MICLLVVLITSTRVKSPVFLQHLTSSSHALRECGIQLNRRDSVYFQGENGHTWIFRGLGDHYLFFEVENSQPIGIRRNGQAQRICNSEDNWRLKPANLVGVKYHLRSIFWENAHRLSLFVALYTDVIANFHWSGVMDAIKSISHVFMEGVLVNVYFW